MWAASALRDEDRLDRAETGRVLRRSIEFAAPYKRFIYAAMGFVTITTVCTVAGPLLVKYAIDRGLVKHQASALNTAIVAYLVVVVVNYLAGASSTWRSTTPARASCATCASACSTGCRRSRWRSTTATRRVCSCRA
jgi:ABC-type multidrug transport system fused ATPase/permease subunit